MNVLTKEAALRPRNALVIEDHAYLARLLVEVFAYAGITAEIMSNGAEAIVRLKNGAGTFGMVCSDVELPGASGWTVLEWVHTCYPTLPMMLVSGTNDEDFILEASRRGAVAAFRKPFKVSEIWQTVAAVFPYL